MLASFFRRAGSTLRDAERREEAYTSAYMITSTLDFVEPRISGSTNFEGGPI